MPVSGWLKVKSQAYLYGVAIFTLLVAIACGAAATPTSPPPAPTSTTAPSAQATATPGPVPTTTPTTAPTPGTAEVKPETVTLMNGVWGNERFVPRDTVGETATYSRPLHGYMVAGNNQTQMIPGVATEWNVSQDGLTWDFKVRSGIKFHDGSELTLDDVVFTINHTFGPEAIEVALHPTAVTTARSIVSIEAAGTDTLRVVQDKAFASFPFLLSELHADSFGAIMPKAYFEQAGLEGYNRSPIGAGAFKLVTYRPAEQVLLERFEDHYFQPDNGFPEDRRPKFQTLDMRLVSSLPTRVAALSAGNVDIIEANIAVRNQIERGGGRIVFSPQSSHSWMLMPGCWKPELACSKKEVRQALDYAIDKQLIIDRLYSADSAIAKGWLFVTPSALGYSPEIDPYPYDPARAQELLAQAGYPGGQGFPRLTIHTWQAGDMPFMPEQAEVIAQMWQDNLGIEAEVVIGDPNTIRGRWFARELDGELIFRTNEARWDGGSVMVGGYADFDSASRRAEDPELRDIVNEAVSVVDPALRHEAYNKAYKALVEAHYEFGTLYVNLPWGVGPRIATWEPWPLAPYQTGLWTITLK